MVFLFSPRELWTNAREFSEGRFVSVFLSSLFIRDFDPVVLPKVEKIYLPPNIGLPVIFYRSRRQINW